MNDPNRMTIDDLITALVAVRDAHPDHEARHRPVHVDALDDPIYITAVAFTDITDECEHCTDPRCAYGGPNSRTGDPHLHDEGLHFAVVITTDLF